jgi:hypothetical protein
VQKETETLTLQSTEASRPEYADLRADASRPRGAATATSLFTTTSMKFLACLSALAFAALALANEGPSELLIETTYEPENCIAKAAPGDKIEVHYTGTLFSTGSKFDSR